MLLGCKLGSCWAMLGPSWSYNVVGRLDCGFFSHSQNHKKSSNQTLFNPLNKLLFDMLVVDFSCFQNIVFFNVCAGSGFVFSRNH